LKRPEKVLKIAFKKRLRIILLKKIF